MSILALDCGTRSGFALIHPPYRRFPSLLERGNGILPPQPDLSGARNFSDYAKHEHRFLAFSDWLVGDLLLGLEPDKVVYEAPLRAQDSASTNSSQLANGWRAIVLLECARLNIPCWHITGSRTKSMALDSKRPPKGEAKEYMMAAARKCGWTFVNDDECDAQWLATFAADIFAGVTPEKIQKATEV